MAEGEGFEPPVPLRVQWFSRPPPSTTRPSLRIEIWPEFARLCKTQTKHRARVTASVTIATARDATGRAHEFDFTFNQSRAFVVITSSSDGNTTRIDLAARTLTGSMTSTSHREGKSYFKSWDLRFLEPGGEGHFTLKV